MRIIFFIFSFSILNANLNYPVDSESISSNQILFKWKQLLNINSYNIQISNDESFETIVVDSMVTHPFCKIERTLEWNKTYFWRVKSMQGVNEKILGESMFSILDNKIDNQLQIFSDDFINRYIAVGISNWAGGSNHYNLSAIIDLMYGEVWNDGNLDVMINNISNTGEFFGGRDTDWSWTSAIEFDIYNNIIWEEPNNINFDHHDFQKNSKGNYMGFIRVDQEGPIPIGEWTPYFQEFGYEADGIISEFTWVAQMLVEVDKNSKEIIWSWNPFDYYTMNDYDALGGTWMNTIIQGWGHYDWLHSNSFYFDEENSHIYISHRHLSRVVKIDYNSGEIIWMIGPSSEFMSSGDEHLCSELGISFQHHVQRLSNNNLLIYDNGNLSHIFRDIESPETRILEVNVENNCEVVFEYIFPSNLTTWGMGSVEKLDNNYLISSYLNDGTIFEINNEKEIIWESNIGKYGLYRAFSTEPLFTNEFEIFFNNLFDTIDSVFVVIENSDMQYSFDICNQSNISQYYIYTLDGNQNNINVSANECENILFNISAMERYDNHDLSIYPYNYAELIKSYEFITIDQGDIGMPKLHQVFPNPTNENISISYLLNSDTNIKLHIYNLLGERVDLIDLGFMSMGYHQFSCNLKNFPSGEYFISLETDNTKNTKKIVLIK